MVGVIKLFVIFSLLILATGCDRKARKDAAAFDGLLSTGRIDHFDGLGGGLGTTNGYYNDHAKSKLRFFAASNRMQTSETFNTNSPARIIFYSGTNLVGSLRYGNQVFVFHDYYFRFKSETNWESRSLFLPLE